MFIGSIEGKKQVKLEKMSMSKAYLNSLAQPSLRSSTTVKAIREDTDKSSLQLNTNDEGEKKFASDDYKYQPPRTSMKRIRSKQ